MDTANPDRGLTIAQQWGISPDVYAAAVEGADNIGRVGDLLYEAGFVERDPEAIKDTLAGIGVCIRTVVEHGTPTDKSALALFLANLLNAGSGVSAEGTDRG